MISKLIEIKKEKKRKKMFLNGKMERTLKLESGWVLGAVLPLYKSAKTDITKYHRQGSLNNWCLFSYNSGDWKSKTVVPELVSGEICLPGL